MEYREDPLTEVSRVRHRVLIALLLPLPFAALPLLSLVFTSPAHTERTEVALESQFVPGTTPKAHPLAFGIADPSQGGCELQSNQAIEG